MTYQVTTTNGAETAQDRGVPHRRHPGPGRPIITVGTKQSTPLAQQLVLLQRQQSSSSSSSSSASSPAPVSSGSSGINWDGIAQCESTNNWSINTGNGYYGGLQFDNSHLGQRWRHCLCLARRPGQPEQQIAVAENVAASRGTSPWACAYAG